MPQKRKEAIKRTVASEMSPTSLPRTPRRRENLQPTGTLVPAWPAHPLALDRALSAPMLGAWRRQPVFMLRRKALSSSTAAASAGEATAQWRPVEKQHRGPQTKSVTDDY